MKKSVFMLAFIVSTAIHVAALTSNLLHVSAESIIENSDRTVTLRIVPSSIRTPSVSPEVAKEIPEIPRTVHSEARDRNKDERSEAPSRELTVVKPPEVAAAEIQPVAEILPPVELPDPPLAETTAAVERYREEWSDSLQPVISDVSQNEVKVCDDCFASLTAVSSGIPKNVDVGGSEYGVTSSAMISLLSKPKYPRYSRLHKEEGTTVLLVEILPDGNLGSVEVENSSGFRRLDQAAVKGIRKADLIPAIKDGKMIASVKRISIIFDLEDWGE